MKTLLLAVAMVCSLVRLDAATLRLDGTLSYNITEPRCSFKLDGKLQNLGPSSGTLKMLLWATPNRFPSPGGHVVGEYTIGTLGNGYQFTSFTVKTPSKLPKITGTYHFTIVIVEYTTGGWRNVLAKSIDTRRLIGGDILGQSKWQIPTAAIAAPPASVKGGTSIKLQALATDEFNLFPTSFRDNTAVAIKSKKALTTTLRGAKRKAQYTYAVKSGKFNKKKVSYGSLSLDYGKSKTTISLYFKNATSGTYKSVETSSSGKETIWGSFQMK